jgi:hypothetical protein
MGVLGQALLDYYSGNEHFPLVVQCDRAPDEIMIPKQFFLSFNEMTKLDKLALTTCKGNVLDVGAGAGRHSLALQNVGLQPTALEMDSSCVEICETVGIQSIKCLSWQDYHPGPTYDSTLALMNGLGLCGTFNGLSEYLSWHLDALVKGGRILVDSSSVSYLPLSKDIKRRKDEVLFRFKYEELISDWFSWLFAERVDAERYMRKVGFINVKCLMSEPQGRFLLTGEKRK